MQPIKMIRINSDIKRCSKCYKITGRITFVKITCNLETFVCVYAQEKCLEGQKSKGLQVQFIYICVCVCTGKMLEGQKSKGL